MKRKINKLKPIIMSAMAASMALLTGCAAVATEVNHHALTVNSKMSSSIFLLPTPHHDRIIYVSVKNTSGEPSIGLKAALTAQLQAKGWRVVNDDRTAHDLVQVNVLQAGKIKDQDSALSSLSNGFGGAVAGGVVGGLATDSTTGVLVGGGLGSAAGFLGGLLVKDITYSIITDVQVSVRVPKGETIHSTTHAVLTEGSSTVVNQDYSNPSQWMQYRVRIVSYANQANLSFREAKPVIAKQMATEIANIF